MPILFLGDVRVARNLRMSEAAPTEEKKKKGKGPVLIVIITILFAGGFFGMKMKGGGEKTKPAVELGKTVDMDEMLVNLSNIETYLRTTIALHLRKDFEETKLKDSMAAVQDAVLSVLKSKSPNDLRAANALPKLKVEIAERVNEVLASVAPAEHGAAEPAESVGSAEKSDPKGKPAVKKKREHPDWESDEGPVLKVYFKAFAIQ